MRGKPVDIGWPKQGQREGMGAVSTQSPLHEGCPKASKRVRGFGPNRVPTRLRRASLPRDAPRSPSRERARSSSVRLNCCVGFRSGPGALGPFSAAPIARWSLKKFPSKTDLLHIQSMTTGLHGWLRGSEPRSTEGPLPTPMRRFRPRREACATREKTGATAARAVAVAAAAAAAAAAVQSAPASRSEPPPLPSGNKRKRCPNRLKRWQACLPCVLRKVRDC